MLLKLKKGRLISFLSMVRVAKEIQKLCIFLLDQVQVLFVVAVQVGIELASGRFQLVNGSRIAFLTNISNFSLHVGALN